VLTFFVGFAACRFLAWLRGNDELMNLMWGVFALSMLAVPVGFCVSLVLYGRLSQRHGARADGKGVSGFPVHRHEHPMK
jgi:hypothetical protein